MQGQDDETEKSFEPTPRKLQEARRKGDVPRSQDLNATAAYIGLFVALAFATSESLMQSASGLLAPLDQAYELSALFFEGSSFGPTGQFLMPHVWFLGVLFGAPMAAVILSVIAQQSVTFAPSKIEPKLSRINPISNAKQKFGASGLFEFAKSFLKLLIFSICLTLFMISEAPGIISTSVLHPGQMIIYLGSLFLQFLAIVIVVSAIIGGVDFIFQFFEHRRKLRMSRKEIMDENKETEGDPYLKNERMQRGRERALDHSLKDVETADVVVTNPTHYAVALHWSREEGSAPVCVAKGVDEIAMAIRERAILHAVPIHEDPPTARALFATTDIGEEVPHDQYPAVAAAIRFSESMRVKMRQRSYG